MKTVKIVIGAHFGDEGKGLMTDYFCSALSPSGTVLNIRFNGTAQAGHTVVRDGKRHVFSHFGAGSLLPNVHTYLSSYFYLEPVKFLAEETALHAMDCRPVVLASENCPVITIYDILCNQLLEKKRGAARHGSCGCGLWETVQREKAGFGLHAADLQQGMEKLERRLLAIRDQYYAPRCAALGLDLSSCAVWSNAELPIWYLLQAKDMLCGMRLTTDRQALSSYSQQVYEGAQGLLLDWDNAPYMPHLTASYTGSRNPMRLLALVQDRADIEICYVTRPYLTRHGAGPLPTETTRERLGAGLSESTNVTNEWQGAFRWGFFDPRLFLQTIERDCTMHHSRPVCRSVCFTHMNTTGDRLLTKEGPLGLDALPLHGKSVYVSHGEDDVTLLRK